MTSKATPVANRTLTTREFAGLRWGSVQVGQLKR